MYVVHTTHAEFNVYGFDLYVHTLPVSNLATVNTSNQAAVESTY